MANMAYSDELLARYVELVTHGISNEHYAGVDVRYLNEFEALESELAKMQSIHASGQVDWQKIRQGSEAILQTHSKDLRAACWLTWALYQTDSFAGLMAGFGMIHHLCTCRWEAFFPGKARTRAAALGWLVPRLNQALTDEVSVKDQLPLFTRLGEYLDGIDEVFTAKLGDEAPLLLPLRRRLATMIRKSRENEAPAPTVIAQVKQAATELFSKSSPIDNEKDAHRALRLQQDNALLLCTWWLRMKATDVRALRLSRAVSWLAIENLPESNAEQVTALRGLPADKVKNYRERFAQGHYADLMVDLETSLARTPFWFDGQYLVWECLQALQAEAAMREVEVQFALFLQRFPGMIDLRFHDGQPFADAATQGWISAQVLPHTQAVTQAPEVVYESVQPPWIAALEAVTPVLRRDGMKAAVQQLKQQMLNAQGDRARFNWQLSLAKLCLKAKKYELAKGQLEVLDQQLRDEQLIRWEPDLYLEVLRLSHRCCELLPQNNLVRECKDELYRRLCHLDLETVLE